MLVASISSFCNHVLCPSQINIWFWKSIYVLCHLQILSLQASPKICHRIWLRVNLEWLVDVASWFIGKSQTFLAIEIFVFVFNVVSEIFLKEHRTEIDARSGTFQAFETFGQQLLHNQHYASENVRERLEELAAAREELEQ